jgi:hypothetical protein
MIRSAQLAAMRSVLDAALPDACMIMRPLTQDIAAGSFAQADMWELVADDVACRVAPTGGIETASGEVASFLITLPAETNVSAQDVLIVDEVAYDVSDVAAPRSEELCVRVRCVRRADQVAPGVGG